MREKLLFIINPYAGKAQIGGELVDIVDIFTKAGYDVVVHPTQSVNDASDFASKNGAEYKKIIVSGGDGTIRGVVEGIMSLKEKDEIQVGYIPSGSTNDFAISLGIPKKRIDAANAILNGKLFKCDIGRFNDRRFNYVAAFGAFTDVSYATPQEFKNAFGHLAYIIEGLSRLPNLSSYAMKVDCDGRVIKGDFVLGMVMNSNSIAGISSENVIQADLSDGLFELLLIKNPSNLLEVQPIIAGLLRGDKEGEGFYLLKGKSFEFETEDDIKWTLDGDYGGNAKSVRISVMEKALNIIVP